MKFILVLFLCLGLAGGVFGQEEGRFRPRSVYDLEAILSSYGINDFYINYDDSKKISTVSSPDQPLDNIDGENFVSRLFLGFYFNFAGKVLKKSPLKYFIIINATQKDGEFLKNNELSFSANGETVTIGTGYRDRNKIGEDVFYSIPAESLRQIAKSKEIKYKIGKFEGTLPDKSVLDLHQIYRISH